jgi:serine protease Do
MKQSSLCLMFLIAIAPQAIAEDSTSTFTVPELVHEVRPSIVLIRTGGTRMDYKRLPQGKQQEPIAAGTGFVVHEGGYILTNNHVVLPELDWPDPEIRVKLSDGKVIEAKLVGRDPLADLAVVKIEASDLRPLKFADPADVRVGQDVVAIGFGMFFELEGMPSVTKGVVSALRRSQSELRGDNYVSLGDLIQTDAAINHGNSGGPLLNLQGQVVGVNTLTEANTQGIHFAVSGQLARQISKMLIADGKVERANLGLVAVSISRQIAGTETRARFSLAEGAFVESVQTDSPAAKAGIQPLDIIERLGDFTIRSEGDLNTALLWLRPGQTARIVYRRYPPGKFDPTRYSPDQDDPGQLETAELVLGEPE